jgi:hypothetical protein
MAQLRRRSTDGGVDSDLSVRDFVVGVDAKIDSETARVANHRWPAFAGLAGVVAILFLLVVALPRFGPGGPSPSPTPEVPPSTISTMPVREFAARVAAGELRGETVMVNAHLPARAGGPCGPPGPCIVGSVAGTEPPLILYANYAASIDSPGGKPVTWSRSYLASAPQAGVMVLSVDEEGKVFFVGRNAPDTIATLMSEIPLVALDQMGLDEIRVVPAWLTGIVAAISCAPPAPGTFIADLPGRYCGNPSWLAPDPMAVDPNGYRIPGDWLEVQSNAYLDYAPTPAGANGSAEPRAGLYVIAKRLEGSGCPNGRPPCWQWEIVGRVTINGDGTPAQPQATPTPTPLASDVPVTRTFTCLSESISVTFDDTTGVVTACSLIGVDRHNSNGATNPNGDLSRLQVLWGSSRCITTASIEFNRVVDSYSAQVTESGPDCESSPDGYLPEAYAVLLTLSTPVQGETVSVSVLRDSEPSGSSPQPISPIDCPTAVRVPMAEQPTWRVLMQDETGLIESCTIGSTLAHVGDPPVVVSNTDGTSLQLLVEWEESPCVNETPFQFRRLGDGYELIVERPSVTCAIPFERRAVHFDVKHPVLASSIAASVRIVGVDPVPTPAVTPPIEVQVIHCDGAPADFSNGGVWIEDHAGLVRDCAVGATQPPDETSLSFGADPPSVTSLCASDSEGFFLEAAIIIRVQ